MSTHDDDGLDGVEIPDDLSSLTASAVPDLVALITQIAGAEPLAAACSLAQVEADVVPTDVGAVAVLRDPAGDAPAHAAAAQSEVRGRTGSLLGHTSGGDSGEHRTRSPKIWPRG